VEFHLNATIGFLIFPCQRKSDSLHILNSEDGLGDITNLPVKTLLQKAKLSSLAALLLVGVPGHFNHGERIRIHMGR